MKTASQPGRSSTAHGLFFILVTPPYLDPALEEKMGSKRNHMLLCPASFRGGSSTRAPAWPSQVPMIHLVLSQPFFCRLALPQSGLTTLISRALACLGSSSPYHPRGNEPCSSSAHDGAPADGQGLMKDVPVLLAWCAGRDGVRAGVAIMNGFSQCP